MMSSFAVAAEAVWGTFRSGRLWAMQILGNAAWFGLFVLWLWIPVATPWHLAGNLVGALLLAVSILLLQAATLRYFSTSGRPESGGLAEAFRAAWRNLPAFAICATLLCLLWYLAGSAAQYQETLPNYLRSLTPQFLRNRLSLHLYEHAVEAGLFALEWILAPGLVLPFLAATAASGFAGFARSGFTTWIKCAGNLYYWGIVAVCAVTGLYFTGRIMDWTPDFRSSTLSREIASLIWRGFACYLFLVWAWMQVCSLSGRLNGESAGVGNDIKGHSAA